MARAKPKLVHSSKMPSQADILAIPVATISEYELTDRETEIMRRRIYALNKDNAAGFRWRTLRERPYTIVWKLPSRR